MCSPILMAAISVAGSVYGSIQQNKAQNAEVTAVNAANALTQQGAREQYALRRNAVDAQAIQQGAGEANTKLESKIAAIRAEGEAGANFAGRGVGGGALASVLNDFAGQAGRARGASDQRLRFAGVSNNFTDAGNYANLAQVYRETPKQGKIKLDMLGMGLSALGSAASSYGSAGGGLSIKSALKGVS